jgi:hypothetical protein
LQWQWGIGGTGQQDNGDDGDRLIAMAMGNGDNGDRSIAMAMGKKTGATGAMAMALGHWGNSDSDCNGALAAICMFYFEDQCHGLWLIKTCKTYGRP